MPRNAICKRLDVNFEKLVRLREEGHLVSALSAGLRVLTERDVAAFDANYVSSRRIAIAAGIGIRLVRELLSQAGIGGLLAGARNDLHRRSEVALIFPELANRSELDAA